MNTLQTITNGLLGHILQGVMPAVLAVLGALLTLVMSVWGVLKIYALLTGQDSADVSRKIGRVFGELVYQEQYEAYKERRERADRDQRFADRYDAEHGIKNWPEIR